MTFGRITIILSVIFAALVALVFAYPNMPWLLPPAAVAEAQGIDNLMRLMFVVSMGIFVFVQGFLLYFVWLYRRRPEDDPDAAGRAIHGDNRLEIAWTVAPALFLVVLTVLSLDVFQGLSLDTMREGAREVNVIGQQFFWTFEYPETGLTEANTLTLEEGEPVALHITGRDVIHAFWVPEFRIKQDATPGFVRTINLTPTEIGEYQLRCAEFCGAGHSTMLATVRVLPSDEYLAWEQGGLEVAANAPEGINVYEQNGCGACHANTAAGAQGNIGPTHDGLAETASQRVADASYTGTAETAEDYIRESIRNPTAFIVPGFQPVMQPYGEEAIDEAELEALVGFLMGEEQP